MAVAPFPVALTSPLEEILATDGVDDAHCTLAPVTMAPSAPRAVALNRSVSPMALNDPVDGVTTTLVTTGVSGVSGADESPEQLISPAQALASTAARIVR
jgi:hypothetical protein